MIPVLRVLHSLPVLPAAAAEHTPLAVTFPAVLWPEAAFALTVPARASIGHALARAAAMRARVLQFTRSTTAWAFHELSLKGRPILRHWIILLDFVHTDLAASVLELMPVEYKMPVVGRAIGAIQKA